MDYRRADDELFGKYCYIDTPWIAGKKTIYRIIRSGVRSNAWCEVPVRGREEIITHDRYEDIIFVALDTLIDEDTKIKRFALKDVEIITADRKTEPQRDDIGNCNICKYVGLEHRCNQCVNGSQFYKIEDEPHTCDTCRYDKEPWHRQVCDECTVGECNWKPKDEPQTEREGE